MLLLAHNQNCVGESVPRVPRPYRSVVDGLDQVAQPCSGCETGAGARYTEGKKAQAGRFHSAKGNHPAGYFILDILEPGQDRIRRSIMEKQPAIGIVLGSASDRSIGKEIVDTLVYFKVPFELVVASAHRTPKEVTAYAEAAEARGLQVLIAVAGLAAHLPGVLAAETILPVIGVPTAVGTLGGLDALLAIAQMPPGIPVATVGLNNGKNAALLAVSILATHNPDLMERLRLYRRELAEKVKAGEQLVWNELDIAGQRGFFDGGL
jgi:5-(carboxyamino)imidazole ribonucleotide mutase